MIKILGKDADGRIKNVRGMRQTLWNAARGIFVVAIYSDQIVDAKCDWENKFFRFCIIIAYVKWYCTIQYGTVHYCTAYSTVAAGLESMNLMSMECLQK